MLKGGDDLEAEIETIYGTVQDVSTFGLYNSSFTLRTVYGKYYATGKILMLHKGMKLKLTGKILSGISGNFMYFTSYEIESPHSAEDVELFLTNISSIGSKTSKKIIEYYGDGTYDQLFVRKNVDDAPVRDKIKDNVRLFMEEFMMQFNIYNKLKLITLPLRKAYSIYKYLQQHSELDFEHPMEIAKLSFVDINDIKRVNTISDDDYFLPEAFALCAIRAKASNPNNEYVELQKAVRSIRYHLSREKIATGIESTKMANSAIDSLAEKEYISIAECCGKEYLSINEIETAKEVIDNFISIDDSRNIDNVIDKAKLVFEDMDVVPSDQQLDAVNALNNNFAIVTGGAGTGKSLVIAAMYKVCERIDLKAFVLTPTGKAADRLSSFGIPAMTIHRKVGYNGAEASKNAYDQLDAEVIIVDESSMVDYMTLAMLIRAMPEFASLILVGDDNQLPPVGIGKPFMQAVGNTKHVYKLERIYRQAGKEGILQASNNVIHGKLPKRKTGEVLYYKAETKEEILSAVQKIYTHLIKKSGEDSTKRNTLIVTTTRDLADSINNIIRNNILSVSQLLPFVVGDKVMQTINNYDKEVFNGEIGYVREVDDGITVEFDNKLVRYTPNEYAEIDYAYATTVYKAQGSEANIVIFPLVQATISNASKELVYTAVTRAKHTLVLITNTKDYFTAVSKSIKDEKEGVMNGNIKTNG